jgi:hypothetical protein
MATASPDNIQLHIDANGTTTLATAGKYCDRNINVDVAVPASGIMPTGSVNITENGTHDVTNYASAVVNVTTAQPTKFTNLYSVNNVTVKSNLGSQSRNTAVYMETYNYGNVLKIPYPHVANEPIVLRMRGIGTVRDRFQCVVTNASDLVVTWGQLNAASVLTYDEHGDACLTLSSPFLQTAWEYMYIVFQYNGVNSGVTEAKTGPIITINEPISNGGYAG